MNIFRKVTLEGLKKSHTRTVVTIIGVILSAAMITAVTTFISSMQHYMIQNVIASDGDWHVEFRDVDYDFTQKLTADKALENIAVTQNIGYAQPDGLRNNYKPYLFVNALSDEAAKMLPLKITSGRLPQNSGEIMIPDHVESNGGVKYTIGDTITIKIGTRTIEGKTLGQSNPYIGSDSVEEGEITEIFTAQTEKIYTVVGICERPTFESFDAPGYNVITKIDPANSTNAALNAYVKLTQSRTVYDYAEKTANGQYSFSFNSELLRYQGISNHDNFNTVLYSLGAILIGLIMVGSILLIHNAFSISVSERTRQFGILSSVGATKKQLRKSVLFEGFCIGLIGIPIGIIAGIGGIGVTLALIGDIFAKMSTTGVTMALALSMPSIIAAALLGISTILVSAYIPARKAAKLSAIDAIRQISDIKIKAKKLKTSKLTQKLFGLEGTLALKNFKRNKKRYRSTVISLFVSIVLFISASAFAMYLQRGADTSVTNSAYDILFSSSVMEDEEAIALYDTFKNVDGITQSGYYKMDYCFTTFPSDRITDRYRENQEAIGNEDNVALFFVDDITYENYIRSLGLDIKEYSGNDISKVVATSKINGYDPESGRYFDFDIFKGSSPINMTVGRYADESLSRDLTISHITEEMPGNMYITTNSGLTVYLPYSAIGDFANEYSLTMTFSSDNPSKSGDKIKAILEDKGITANYSIYNMAEVYEANRSVMLVINVFSYGFIILISLITIANVFNTISTNINLRRREFAMLRSVGMTNRGFNKMMNFECIFYGLKSLLYGLPTAIFIVFLLYKSVMAGADVPFTLPWLSIAISIFSVFLVVFITMLYSVSKVKRENTIDALKSDI